ncbi:hypothetical protein FMGBMHLM_1310 [Methylobacterium aerolatum]|nr:hypothetical protein FMGBMHLM_1310 [Methylobacterium aerolatum]
MSSPVTGSRFASRFFPDIAFLTEHGVPLRRLAQAIVLARRSGTDAASALLRAGLTDEDTYYRALATRLGLPFLDGAIPLDPASAYPECLRDGVASLAPGHGAAVVLAPRGRDIGDLLDEEAAHGPAALAGWAITTPTRLRLAVYGTMPAHVAAHAAGERDGPAPERAFARRPASHRLLALAVALSAALAVVAALPETAILPSVVAAQVLCLAAMVFRLGALVIPPPEVEAPPLPDAALPVYTVLVALHREAAVLRRLLPALAALDYPVAKLDIKLLIEADDAETAAALAAIPLPARFEVVTVPPGDPRTKPRALNAALPLARGDLLVVYDAEDVPEPDQLRRAASVFARAPSATACLQGRLVIDNHEGWLPRLFALEYAGLFDVVNPALAALGMPIPLGGTSMHLRTEVLRRLGGWNAWSVTEDAELGLRLALAGYRMGDLPSATFEEAPLGARSWLRQRCRWMKGFLQISLDHGRRPLATLSRLGPLRSLCAVALVPGAVLSALAYPVCFLATAWVFLRGGIEASPSLLENVATGLAVTVFLVGLVCLVGPMVQGCWRRRWFDLLPFFVLLPFYCLFLGAAAGCALVEFVRAPYRWNKTEHGLSRTTRSGWLTPVGPG